MDADVCPPLYEGRYIMVLVPQGLRGWTRASRVVARAVHPLISDCSKMMRAQVVPLSTQPPSQNLGSC